MPKATKSNYVPTPAGVHHAVCYAAIDIGTQPAFGRFPARRKVMLIWELPEERIEVTVNGAPTMLPRSISKEYTLSTGAKSNLRKDLASWRGRDFTPEEIEEFEVGKVVGANCQVCVVHKPSADGSRIYANVQSIMPLPKGVQKLTPENPALVFDIPREGPISFPDIMPEWIVNKIKNSEQYADRQNPQRAQARAESQADARPPVDLDVPF